MAWRPPGGWVRSGHLLGVFLLAAPRQVGQVLVANHQVVLVLSDSHQGGQNLADRRPVVLSALAELHRGGSHWALPLGHKARQLSVHHLPG